MERGLTKREREVGDLLRRGQSNKEIAAELGISRDRAKELVAQICRKLQVANRTEAAVALERLRPPRRGGVIRIIPHGYRFTEGGPHLGPSATALFGVRSMTITIPRPRLLLLAVGLLVAAAAAYTAFADNGQTDPPLEYIPVGPTAELPTVTPEEGARAREVLAAHEVFQNVTRHTKWRVTSEIPGTMNGEKDGLALIIELESPVDSDGPWTKLFCQGTVSLEVTFPYQRITTLAAIFTDGGGEIISLAPLITSPETTFGADPDDPAYAAPACPEGFEDDD